MLQSLKRNPKQRRKHKYYIIRIGVTHMREKELSKEHSPSDVKQALAIASKMGGNMTGATAAIEKKSKGLSKHKQVAAVLKRANEEVKEGLGDLAHLAEQDHEVQMARAELYKLAKYAIKLHEMLKGVSETEGLEGWVQSKITKSADMIGSVYHHLEYQESPMGEVTEAKDTHCSDKCCGSDVKAEDCTCPPTCKHCNCNAVSESADRSLKKHAETLNKHIPDNKRSEEFVKIMATKYAAKYSIDADDLFDTYNAMFSLHQGGSPFLKKETYKESLQGKLNAKLGK